MSPHNQKHMRTLHRTLPRVRALRFLSYTIAALLFVVATTSTVRADEFVLEDGNRIEGRVLSEDDRAYRVHTAKGIVTVAKNSVDKHRRKKTKFDRYLIRRDRLDTKSASQQLKLAEWCAKQPLPRQASLHYDLALELDPKSKAAQKGSRKYRRYRAAESRTTAESDQDGTRTKKKSDKKQTPSRGSVGIRLKGNKGTEFDQGYLKQEIRKLLKSLDPTLTLSTSQNCEYYLEIQVTSSFVKTTKFYGKIAITDHYRGTAKVALYSHDDRKKPILRWKKLEQSARLSTKLGKEMCHRAVRQRVTDEIVARLSRHTFFKKRGAEPKPFSDTD